MDHDFNRRSFESGGGSAILMFVAGAALGAAAALILAPSTGADARAFLGRRSRELADDVATRGKQLWNEHGDRVTNAVKRGYETATGSTARNETVNGATESGHSM